MNTSTMIPHITNPEIHALVAETGYIDTTMIMERARVERARAVRGWIRAGLTRLKEVGDFLVHGGFAPHH